MTEELTEERRQALEHHHKRLEHPAYERAKDPESAIYVGDWVVFRVEYNVKVVGVVFLCIPTREDPPHYSYTIRRLVDLLQQGRGPTYARLRDQIRLVDEHFGLPGLDLFPGLNPPGFAKWREGGER